MCGIISRERRIIARERLIISREPGEQVGLISASREMRKSGRLLERL